jgi:putative SOS response-associated peptidase YedK
VGPDSELGQRSKNRLQDHQCESRDGRYGTVISSGVRETALSVPSDGFYEWKRVPGGKIPYSIGMKDDSPFVFAEYGKAVRPRERRWLHTCTIITGEPNEFVREIHTRMPVILPEERLDSWLSGEAGKEILVPFPADRIKAWPVSSRVNSPQNDDAEIIAPIDF